MYAIAVTSPEGRTRFVGKSIPWVDATARALPFDSEEEAQSFINHPNTATGNRVRDGWSARAVAI